MPWQRAEKLALKTSEEVLKQMQSTPILNSIIEAASKRGPKKYSRHRMNPFFAKTTAQLLAVEAEKAAAERDELAKRTINAERASGPGKAAQ